MRNNLLLSVIIAITILSSNFLVLAKPEELQLTIIEMRLNGRPAKPSPIPSTDDSSTNPDYGTLSYHWYTTASYYVNGANNIGLTPSDVVTAVTISANTWDVETSNAVFSFIGSTDLKAGLRDNFNVVSFGTYKRGVIGVTYLWSSGGRLLETDTILNTYYGWSLTGGSGKMDVQNIMTHEFGHWCGLNDLYANKDYWLTMYGYSNYGYTYERTLGLGDILGLQSVYGI